MKKKFYRNFIHHLVKLNSIDNFFAFHQFSKLIKNFLILYYISSLKMSARRCNLCATLAQLRDLRGKRKVYCGLLGIISRKNSKCSKQGSAEESQSQSQVWKQWVQSLSWILWSFDMWLWMHDQKYLKLSSNVL